jgi:hypothetical protein
MPNSASVEVTFKMTNKDTLYIFYFAVSAILTLTMPSSVSCYLLGSALGVQWLEQVGCFFSLISSLLSLAWILVAFFVGLSLIRPDEKITAQMNLASITSLAHCGYYGVLALWCFANNNLHLNFGLTSESSQLYAFWIFSGVYLYPLSLANMRQLKAFWQKVHRLGHPV